MIVGIGIDLVDLKEFDTTIFSNVRVQHKIFTSKEMLLNKISLAASFASKEALIKALGTINEFKWKDVEVSHEKSGKPKFLFYNDMFKLMGKYEVLLSITHTSFTAAAFVVIQNR